MASLTSHDTGCRLAADGGKKKTFESPFKDAMDRLRAWSHRQLETGFDLNQEDLVDEFQLALANRDLRPEIETSFLVTEHSHVYVSSSLVKEIAANGGSVSRYVSPVVAEALSKKMQDRTNG